MPHSVAIVGTGPAGFYCAEALLKKAPEARIDLIDRLPTPFGLVRSGVAPDHQSTKSVSRVYDRIARRPNVRFLGNVEIGRDVSVAELLERYDAVVLAIGVGVDRKLGIPGEELRGVYGSGAFTGWYNGHPDFADLSPELRGPGLAVIGNGNVAIDVVRVIARTRAEMAKTDLPEYAMRAIEEADFSDVYLLGRRGPMDASFTPAELRELGELAETVALVDPADLPAETPSDKLKEKIVDTLREYARSDPGAKRRRLHLRFFAAPVRILGSERVEGIEIARTKIEDGRAVPTGETYVLPAGTVVTAIGYGARALEGVPIAKSGTSYENEGGKIADRLWAVGWAKRGPSGVIGTNRNDSAEVANKIAAELTGEPRANDIDALLAARGVRVVDLAGWDRIDAKERSELPEGCPRRKLTSFEALLKSC